MSEFNPLKKYYRQPKIFVSLPSKGIFYPPGALQGDHSNMPVFGMTGMDEILFKTPDALFNGEASSKVIESCCPFIKNARAMPSIDVDAVLIAIRLATYGDQMTVSHKCKHCGAEHDYDIDLKNIIEYFSTIQFNTSIPIGDITVQIKPLSYDEMTAFSVENFKLQRTLYQTNDIPEADQQEHINNIYRRLADIQVQLFMLSIASVATPDGVVEDPEMIRDWLQNSDKSMYATIKEHLEKNKETWSIPRQHMQCSECGTEDSFEIALDQSNFFG